MQSARGSPVLHNENPDKFELPLFDGSFWLPFLAAVSFSCPEL